MAPIIGQYLSDQIALAIIHWTVLREHASEVFCAM